MALLEDLIGSIRTDDIQVANLIVSPFWTLVTASNCGIASTMLDPEARGVELACTVRERRIGDVVQLALSANPLEASVGIAALNSALVGQVDARHYRPYRIPRAGGKTVAIVGDLPFADMLREVAREVWAVRPDQKTGDYRNTEVESVLPKADIAIIDGSAIISKSLEHLLDLSKSCFTAVVGPSTPLSPLLFKYGANQIAGIKVRDEEAATRCISEGIKVISGCRWLKPVVIAGDQQSI
jgi:uncharacterized protein (DUF4213/DUF364 family)